MLKYYQPYRDNDIVYSCDMLRLKFHLHTNIVQSFFNSLSNWELQLGYKIEYYKPIFKLGSYRHLFKLEKDSYVISLGVGLNTGQASNGVDCFIEFNPNKSDMDFVTFFLECISQYIVSVENAKFRLVRFDLAIDIPIPREFVVLVRKGKREYHKIIGSSLTEYVGKRNSGGFTKVYDKGYESELEYDLTRIEVTCDDLSMFKLPDVCILSSIDDDLTDLNSTDKVIVKLLRNLSSDEQQQALKEMGRVKANKLRQYIFPIDTRFKYNMSCIDWVTMEIMKILKIGVCVDEIG